MELKLRFALLIWVTSFCANCVSHAKNEPANSQLPLISIDDFFQNSDEYYDQRIRVRGYLFKSVTRTWFLHRTMEDGWKPNVPFILVVPDGEKSFLNGAFADLLRCGDNYVELTGYAGQLPQESGVGITQVERVSVFESENFSGDSALCFESSEL